MIKYSKTFSHIDTTFSIDVILYFKIEKKMDGVTIHRIYVSENGPQLTSYEKTYDVTVKSSATDTTKVLNDAISLAISEAIAWTEDIPNNKTPEQVLLLDLGFEIQSD